MLLLSAVGTVHAPLSFHLRLEKQEQHFDEDADWFFSLSPK
jgi:hypothetical protein